MTTEANEVNEASTISTALLARLLGRSTRRIRALVSAGVLPPAKGGKHSLFAAVNAFLDRQAELVEAAGTSTTSEERAARARLWASRAMLSEMDVKKREGELVVQADVNRAWLHAVTVVRVRLLSIGKKLALRLAQERTAAACCEAIETEIRLACEELGTATVKEKENGNGDAQNATPGDSKNDGNGDRGTAAASG